MKPHYGPKSNTAPLPKRANCRGQRVTIIPAFRRGDRLPLTSQRLDLSTEIAFVSRTRDQMERAEQLAARAFVQLPCCPTLHDKPLLCVGPAHRLGDDTTHRQRT